jgi:hypothetical protein
MTNRSESRAKGPTRATARVYARVVRRRSHRAENAPAATDQLSTPLRVGPHPQRFGLEDAYLSRWDLRDARARKRSRLTALKPCVPGVVFTRAEMSSRHPSGRRCGDQAGRQHPWLTRTDRTRLCLQRDNRRRVSLRSSLHNSLAPRCPSFA